MFVVYLCRDVNNYNFNKGTLHINTYQYKDVLGGFDFLLMVQECHLYSS